MPPAFASGCLIEGAWVQFVQRVNRNERSNVIDLGTFLFGQERYIYARTCRRAKAGRSDLVRLMEARKGGCWTFAVRFQAHG